MDKTETKCIDTKASDLVDKFAIALDTIGRSRLCRINMTSYMKNALLLRKVSVHNIVWCAVDVSDAYSHHYILFCADGKVHYGPLV